MAADGKLNMQMRVIGDKSARRIPLKDAANGARDVDAVSALVLLGNQEWNATQSGNRFGRTPRSNSQHQATIDQLAQPFPNMEGLARMVQTLPRILDLGKLRERPGVMG